MRNRLRRAVKVVVNACAWLVALPFALTCRLEPARRGSADSIFGFWAHVFALAPGLPGVYLRRAFYRLTLDHVGRDCYIGFGTIFTRRNASIGARAYVGAYSLVGCARIGARSLVGSRVSLLSGKYQHALDAAGSWTRGERAGIARVEIGEDVWIGEGALVMADVGDHSMVAAGAVVGSGVRAWTMVGGNPARFVRGLSPAESGEVREEGGRAIPQLAVH